MSNLLSKLKKLDEGEFAEKSVVESLKNSILDLEAENKMQEWSLDKFYKDYKYMSFNQLPELYKIIFKKLLIFPYDIQKYHYQFSVLSSDLISYERDLVGEIIEKYREAYPEKTMNRKDRDEVENGDD